MLVPERNRSLKAIFCVQLPPQRAVATDLGAGNSVGAWDSHAFLESSSAISTATGLTAGNLQDYQWRIGGKYYPAQRVLCNQTATLTNGAAEAYLEFQKALNIVGDYRLSTGISAGRWTRPLAAATGESCAVDFTGLTELTDITDQTPYIRGPSCFVISADLETSDGTEISGLNGEEQNDIALMINYSAAQSATCFYNVYVFYDALLVLRENNLVELIK